MKRYLSVFEMIARSSMYKVLLAIAAMVVAELIYFYLAITNVHGTSIEEYIDDSYFGIVFKIKYTLITVFLILPGMNIGSVQSYTLKRLRIKEKWIYWLQATYNFLAFVLLWGVQLMVILGMIIIFANNSPEGVIITNQTMFLAFYRDQFMHSILPLEDAINWLVLISVGAVTALAAAEFTKLQRVGKKALELCVMVAITWIIFPRELGYDFTFWLIGIVSVCLVMLLRWVYHRLGD